MTDILPFPSGRNHSRSGTGPAENEPSPAPSGTSGTVLENSSDNSEPPPAMPAAESMISAPVLVPEVADVPPASNSESFLPNSLPDVPDVGASLPDTCRTGAGPEQPAAGQDPPEPLRPEALPARPLLVRGFVSVGPMTQPRESFVQYENADLRELLLAADLADDTIIEADRDAGISILDLDVHHWPEVPSSRELEAHLSTISPQPDAAWTSHGLGLKLSYVGAHHADRALAAAFSAPQAFHVELLSHTRHPGAA